MTLKNRIRNTTGLKTYAEQKNKETIEKVNQAIDKLKRSKTRSINFKTVAEEAGVSKATLYNNDILKERILSLRTIKKGVFPSNKVIDTSKGKDNINEQSDKIKQLREEIKRLKEDKKKLIVQLVEMEELRMENQRLRKRFEKT